MGATYPVIVAYVAGQPPLGISRPAGRSGQAARAGDRRGVLHVRRGDTGAREARSGRTCSWEGQVKGLLNAERDAFGVGPLQLLVA